MSRVNLKEVKAALNQLPDEQLENFYVSHLMAIEDPEIELGIVFHDNGEDDEGDEGEYTTPHNRDLYDTKAYKVLEEFVKAIEDDAMKVAAAKLCEDVADNFSEDDV